MADEKPRDRILILIGTEDDVRKKEGFVVITSSEAAVLLGISESKFRKHFVDGGLIRAVGAIGKARLFLRDRVIELKAMS